MIVRVPAKITIISQVGGAKSRPPVDTERVGQAELARPVGKVGKCSLIVKRSVYAYQEFVQEGIGNQPVIVCRNIMNGVVGPRRSSTVCRGCWIGKNATFRGVIARAPGVSDRQGVFVAEVLVSFNGQVPQLGSVGIEVDEIKAPVRIDIGRWPGGERAQRLGGSANPVKWNDVAREGLAVTVGVCGQRIIDCD